MADLFTEFLAALRHTTPTEAAGTATGVACVLLAARNSIWNFPVAIVSCALYLFVFIDARLYFDAGLQVAFIGLAAYGWRAWQQRRGAAAPELPITSTRGHLWGVLTALGLAFALGAGYLSGRYTDAALPYYDSSTTAVSLMAQYLLSRRKIENWLLWIGVDVVYVGMYWQRGLVLTMLLYAAYLGLAAYGYWEWRRAARRPAIA